MAAAGSDVIRVLSWNINGLKEKFKRRDRKTALLKIFDKYDIVLLQETKIGNMTDDEVDDKNWEIITNALSDKYALVKLEDQTCRETAAQEEEEEEVTKGLSTLNLEDQKKEEKKKTMRKTMYMTYFRPNSKGVAIIVNKPHTLLSSFSAGGDYAWVHVEIDGQKYTFVSVYYHKDYPHLICNLMLEIFYSFLTEGYDAFKCRLVIGGDFNTTLNPKLDLTRVNPDHAARRNKLNAFLSIVKLTDVWREEHPGERKYTYMFMSRLDYVFMLKDAVKYVTSCEIHNEIVLSDHSPVSLTLNYTH